MCANTKCKYEYWRTLNGANSRTNSSKHFFEVLQIIVS